MKILVVFGQKNYRFGKKNYCLLTTSEEKNKIKPKCQFFFLVGDNFISSEDSSPIEYTESGLKAGMLGDSVQVCSTGNSKCSDVGPEISERGCLG